MKKKIQLMMLVVLAAAFVIPYLAQAEGLQERSHVVNFQGALNDGDGLPYDGLVDIEASFFNATQEIYRESFADVEVRRGMFRLPLLQGLVESGSSQAVVDGSDGELYVDIAIDGVVMLDRHAIGTQLAAVRAERADYAYAIKDGFNLTIDQIPEHDAIKVTSGIIADGRLPNIPISKFRSGQLTYDQLPQIEPDRVVSGVFGQNLLPNALDAAIFTSGTLIDSVLPQDIILRDNIYIGAGTAGHFGVVPVPVGFTRDNCQWVVGIKDIDGHEGVDQFRVYTDADGVISCRWSPYEADAELNNFCMASYMVICLK